MTDTTVFALSYLADYRTGFFDQLEKDCVGPVAILHPDGSIDASVRTVIRPNSVLTEPIRTVAGGLHTRRGLVQQVARQRPRAVVIESSARDIGYIRLLLWCRWRRIPVAIWGLGRSNRSHRTLVDKLAGELFVAAQVALSNRVIGKGQGPADYYGRIPLQKHKVTFAPNSSGIEEELSTITRPVRPSVTVEAPLRMLFVGRVTPRKELQLTLRALAVELPSELWHLDVVGQGESVVDLQRLTRELNREANVTFHGNLQGEDLIQRYREADALTLPGKGGLVIPEAFAAALPVVTGPMDHAGDGTLPALLDPGKNSFVAPATDLAGQRSAIRELVEVIDAGRFEEMRTAARRSHTHHGGVSAMSGVFADFLNQAVQLNGPS